MVEIYEALSFTRAWSFLWIIVIFLIFKLSGNASQQNNVFTKRFEGLMAILISFFVERVVDMADAIIPSFFDEHNEDCESTSLLSNSGFCWDLCSILISLEKLIPSSNKMGVIYFSRLLSKYIYQKAMHLRFHKFALFITAEHSNFCHFHSLFSSFSQNIK